MDVAYNSNRGECGVPTSEAANLSLILHDRRLFPAGDGIRYSVSLVKLLGG